MGSNTPDMTLDDDMNPGTPAARTPAPAAAPAEEGAPGTPAESLFSELDEKDLFGDESDAEDEVAPGVSAGGKEDTTLDDVNRTETLPGTPAARTPAPAAAPAEEGAPGTPAESLFSELDEKDIFGDVSDLEDAEAPGLSAGGTEEVTLLKRPAPAEDRRFEPLRLPNVLAIETHAFRRDRIPPRLLEGYREYKNMQDKEVVRLLSPENCIRWRFKKDKDGNILTDEDGRPQYESNSRIVEWEDGSLTLFVGNEAFKMSRIKDKVLLFEENSPDVHVCHGVMQHRLIATPSNLETQTHKLLKKSQFQKIEPVRRTLLQSAQEQEAAIEMQALEQQQRKRQEKQLKRAAEELESGMNKAFLEDGADDGGDGGSVLDIKRLRKA
eukprot:TRINITY_DN930_c0_g1_i2.p1 TRINITY_DN930_c0_g1~~TRINITY_DN930_c0_g1_i2.p1  ORF type:complete len:382 (-),score=107.01 TRINITY_DN930_c0_g1_i2:132-1277(-)